MSRLKIVLAATVVAGVTVLSTAAAGVFASTPDACATGIYEGYCGTQEDSSTVPLYLAVSGTTIIGTSNSTFGTADFFWFAYEGGTNKIAEWAPDGIASNDVMAAVLQRSRNSSSWAVVLQSGTGETNQQWTYNGTGWTNVAAGPGYVLQTNGNNNPVTLVPAPVSATPNQTFTFVEGY